MAASPRWQHPSKSITRPPHSHSSVGLWAVRDDWGRGHTYSQNPQAESIVTPSLIWASTLENELFQLRSISFISSQKADKTSWEQSRVSSEVSRAATPSPGKMAAWTGTSPPPPSLSAFFSHLSGQRSMKYFVLGTLNILEKLYILTHF